MEFGGTSGITGLFRSRGRRVKGNRKLDRMCFFVDSRVFRASTVGDELFFVAADVFVYMFILSISSSERAEYTCAHFDGVN